MKQFTLDTTLGELIEEMRAERQGLSLQQVLFFGDALAGEDATYSVLIGKGAGAGLAMRSFMDAVRAATGAEGERIEFVVGQSDNVSQERF